MIFVFYKTLFETTMGNHAFRDPVSVEKHHELVNGITVRKFSGEFQSEFETTIVPDPNNDKNSINYVDYFYSHFPIIKYIDITQLVKT